MSEPFDTARPMRASAPPIRIDAFLPILILGLVLLAWFVFQAAQLRLERDALQATFAAQETSMGDAKKLRDSLEAIAQGTARLADGGNPGARLVVEELNKRGVRIAHPPAAGSAPPTAPTPAR